MVAGIKFSRCVIVVNVFAWSLVACAAPVKKAETEETINYQNWLLARCIAKAYPQTDVAQDAAYTAGAFLEKGNLPFAAYESGEKLVETQLKKDYQGSTGGKYEIKKCIDLLRANIQPAN